MQRQLEDYFEARGAEVFNAPVDVILSDHDIAVPDLVIVLEPPPSTQRAIEAPPVLVVEILSPSTRSRDRGIKAQRYAALGIAHYWIVDAAKKTIECFKAAESGYALLAELRGPVELTHPDFDGLAIDLGKVWS